MQVSRPTRWPTLLAIVALTYAVCAVFYPIVGFEFVDLDVDEQLIGNPNTRGLTGENLQRIVTGQGPEGITTSYYPVRTLTYAINYELWGLNPFGFKLTNGLIHLANVLLVFWLVLRLFRRTGVAEGLSRQVRDVMVATLSAGAFAVHPVVVEPVVWVAGREELLMTLGALGCLHFHITARRLSEQHGKTRQIVACYACAAVSCAAACLSNAVAAVIPLLIVAWDILTLTPPKLRRIVCATAALWLIGGATIYLKTLSSAKDVVAEEAAAFSAVIEQLGDVSDPVAEEREAVSAAIERIVDADVPRFPGPELCSVEQVLLVLQVYWVNLKTLVWPAQLALVYPNLSPRSFGDLQVILGSVAVGLTCLGLWLVRRKRFVLFGLLWFGLALGPTSQVMPHHIHRADRFLYLPLVGLALAMAMGLRPFAMAPRGREAVAKVFAAGVLGLLVLGVLSARQVQTWRDGLSVWENCVRVSPDSALAHRGLAENLAMRGHMNHANEHIALATRLDPSGVEKLNSLARELATPDGQGSRNCELAIELAELACTFTAWEDARYLQTLAVAHRSLADILAGRGEFGSAADNYKKALDVASDTEFLDEVRRLLKDCHEEGACPE